MTAFTLWANVNLAVERRYANLVVSSGGILPVIFAKGLQAARILWSTNKSCSDYKHYWDIFNDKATVT